MKLEEKHPSDLVSACLQDREALKDLTLTLHEPVCLEIGSYIGLTATAMVAGGASKVYCVDLWSGDLHKEGWKNGWQIDKAKGQDVLARFCKTVPNLFDKIIPIIGSSSFWASLWQTPIDLLFIDGDHSYKECANDIQIWSKHVRPGGIICGHDIHLEGVQKAVKEQGAFKIKGNSVWVLTN